MTSIAEMTLEEAAREAAGNHREFDSFAWWDRPDDDETWTLVNLSHRDSDILDQSNAAVIEKALEPFPDDVTAHRFNHWLVGYSESLAIRVYTPAGEITEAFQTYYELVERQREYPVLDETDFSRREYDAAHESIKDAARSLKGDYDLPEGWVHQVWEWLWENEQGELENTDGRGAYPSEDAIKQAFRGLGFVNQEILAMVQETADALRVDVEFLKTEVALGRTPDPQLVIDLAERALRLVDDVEDELS